MHLRAFGVAGFQAFFPYFDVDGFDQIGRRPRQAERLEQVGDGLRKVADVAGGLRGKCGRQVHLRQCPVHMVAQALQQAAHPLQFSHKVRHRTVVAPFMRQRNAQPPRVALDQLAVGLCGRPIRHELARCSASAVVHKGGCVAHRAAVAALCGDQARQVRSGRRNREHAARGFVADVAIDPGGDADRAAAVCGVRQGKHASGHNRRRTGRGAAGGVGQVPGVARNVHRWVFCRTAHAKLRRGGAADHVQTRLAQAPCQKAVGRRAVAFHQQRTHFLQAPLERGAEVLHQVRHAGKRACGVHAIAQGVGHDIVKQLDHGAQGGVDQGHPCRRLLGQLCGADVALANPLCQAHGIVPGPFIPIHDA